MKVLRTFETVLCRFKNPFAHCKYLSQNSKKFFYFICYFLLIGERERDLDFDFDFDLDLCL